MVLCTDMKKKRLEITCVTLFTSIAFPTKSQLQNSTLTFEDKRLPLKKKRYSVVYSTLDSKIRLNTTGIELNTIRKGKQSVCIFAMYFDI